MALLRGASEAHCRSGEGKGQPCIHGPGIPAATVVAMVADGMTTAEILADLRALEAEDVAAALRLRCRGRSRA